MLDILARLRKKYIIGFVGGSDLAKITEQLQVDGSNGKDSPFLLGKLCSPPTVLDNFDYAFAENGLTAYKMGVPLESQSFIKFVGEERYKPLVNFILHYVADLDIPIKR